MVNTHELGEELQPDCGMRISDCSEVTRETGPLRRRLFRIRNQKSIHSARSATIGSTFAALRAGIRLATVATASSRTTTPA
jgi:hypothetical protein